MLGLEKQEYPKISTLPTRKNLENGVHGKILVITGAQQELVRLLLEVL